MGFIKKDAIKTMFLSYLGMFLGYFNKAFLFVWVLSVEQIGLINLLVSVSLLFGNLSSLGTNYAIWKFFPFLKNKQNKNHGFLPLVLLISLLGASIFTILIIVFKDFLLGFYIKKSVLFIEYYYWVIVLGFSAVLYQTLETFLRSMYKNIVAVIVYELILRISITFLLILLWLNVINFQLFVVLHCLFYFIPVTILIIYLIYLKEWSLSIKEIKIPKKLQTIIISYTSFSYFNSIGNIFVTTIDAMMIASFLGLKYTGIYTTIIFITSALQIPYKSLLRITNPIIPQYWKEKNIEKMEKLYKKFSSVNLVISLVIFVLFWINRNEFFSLLPNEFNEGIYVFLFVMIGKLVDMYMGLNGVIFVTSKKYKYDLIFTFTLIISVIVFNNYLIPIYGMAGAAISTAIGMIIYNVGRLIFVWVVYKIHPFQLNQLVVFLIVATLLFIMEMLPTFSNLLVVQVGLKSFVFLVLFAIPFYIFKLEPEILGFFKKKK